MEGERNRTDEAVFFFCVSLLRFPDNKSMSKAQNQKQKKNKLMQTPLSASSLKKQQRFQSITIIIITRTIWKVLVSWGRFLCPCNAGSGVSNGLGYSSLVICSTWDHHHHHQRASTFAVDDTHAGIVLSASSPSLRSPSIVGSFHLVSIDEECTSKKHHQFL